MVTTSTPSASRTGCSDQRVLGRIVPLNSTTTSRTNGLQVVSNPAISETTGTTGTTAAAGFRALSSR